LDFPIKINNSINFNKNQYKSNAPGKNRLDF